MTILLSVIHDIPSNTLEATWAEEGVTVKCQNYSIEQKDMFVADCAEFSTPPESSDFASVCAAWLDPSNNINPHSSTAPVVPASVSRFQARAALAQAGLLSTVDTYMSGLPADNIQRLAWQDATEFYRSSATVAAMASMLGLTDEQVDDLFVTAATIQA